MGRPTPILLSGSSSSSDGPSSSPQSVSAVTPGGLTAALAEDKNAISTGGSVTYTLTLANTTAQPIVYQSTTGFGITNIVGEVESNVSVADAAGHSLYPSPMNVGGCGAIGTPVPVTVAAGQSLTETVTVGGVFSSTSRDTAAATLLVESTPNGPFQTTTVGPLTVTVQ